MVGNWVWNGLLQVTGMGPEEGGSMSQIVDRPWPVNYEYRGISSQIGFAWGQPDNPVPIGLRVSVQHPDRVVLTTRETSEFSSFEQAVERGQQMAKVQIDLLLKDGKFSGNPDQ
jgi:hypothetical protein